MKRTVYSIVLAACFATAFAQQPKPPAIVTDNEFQKVLVAVSNEDWDNAVALSSKFLKQMNDDDKRLFAQFGRYGGETNGTFKADLRHVLAYDDGRVVGIHHNRGERNGKQLDVDCCIAFELKDGRITSVEHFYNLHAWEDFWS